LKKAGHVISMVIFAAALLAGWIYLTSRGPAMTDAPESRDGMIDLTGTDLENEIVSVTDGADFYPDSLITPEELDSGEAGVKPESTVNHDDTATGTYHLRLKLLPDTSYLMCGYSLDYSTHLYVNGKTEAEVGKVGSTAESSVPRINYYIVPVTADAEGYADIVIWYANFVHPEGGGFNEILISSAVNIDRYQVDTTLPEYLLCGGFMIFAIYYFLEFVLRRKKDTVFMAICCVLFAVRNQRFFVTQLLPWNYSWPVCYRLLNIFLALMPWAVFMVFACLYEKNAKKYLVTAECVTAGFSVVLLIAAPTFYSSRIYTYSVIIQAGWIALLLLFIIRSFIIKRSFNRKDAITFSGMVLLVATLVFDAWWQSIKPSITRSGIAPVGMFAFVLLLKIVMDIRHGEAEAALLESRRTAQTLERQQTMRQTFMAEISHEMKTPLTIISGYAQRIRMKSDDYRLPEEAVQELDYIKSETQRLGMLVEQVLDNSAKGLDKAAIGDMPVCEILERIRKLSEPLLQKNGNVLKTDDETRNTSVSGNMEMVLQVLLNFVVNSNRHTSGDTITLTASSRNDGYIWFTFADHGSGMSQEQKDYAFIRGSSGDGKTGLGLPICHDIIQSMGGRIYIESQAGEGTAVFFSLKEAEAAEKEE